MKKTILTAMLFFAFLVMGVQNVNAQYVSVDDAAALLQTEVQSIYNNSSYTNNQTKDAQWIYLDEKVELYTFVYDQILAGSTVEAAVELGVVRHNFSSNSNSLVSVKAVKNHTPSPLEAELKDLLD